MVRPTAPCGHPEGEWGDGGEYEGISVSKEKFGVSKGHSHPSKKSHWGGYSAGQATSFSPVSKKALTAPPFLLQQLPTKL